MPIKPKPIIIIGIDPGLHGSIVVLQIDSKLLRLIKVTFIDIPLTEKTSGEGNAVDCKELLENVEMVLPSNRLDYECYAFIEEVHALPRQGVTGAFSFGNTA